MKWNYFAVLVGIGVVLVNIRIGDCGPFPYHWSTIQDMYNTVQDLYPQNDHQAEIARNALHGSEYGGDILIADDAPTPESAAIKGNTYRWPGFPGNGQIPYVISNQLSSIKSKIYSAMRQYEKHTCIKFVPKKKKHKDYIYIRDGRGCSSFIGRQGGKQFVTLGKGCEYVGTIVHELGHAIGLYHEHQRYDRNKYIKIFPRNISPREEHNFDRTPKSEQIVFNSFDYQSIMIYGEYAFSVSPGRLKTMRSKKKNVSLKEPFQKPGMDNLDIKQVNKLYEC